MVVLVRKGDGKPYVFTDETEMRRWLRKRGRLAGLLYTRHDVTVNPPQDS